MSVQLFTISFLAFVTCSSLTRSMPTSPWKPNIDERLLVQCQSLYSSESGAYFFETAGLEDFSRIVIDSGRRQLIVGARNHLLRLDAANLSVIERVSYLPDNLTINICVAKGQSESDCQNFIRVLLLHNDQVFVCGTNAFAPQCSWRKLTRLSEVTSTVGGVAKCPYSPHQNSTYLMTSDGNLYSATVTDMTGRDSAIYRMMGPFKHLRTVQYNSRWLNDPDFISAYEIGDYVYFFFRETAVEFINCGKNDSGGRFLLEDNWTTFVKARLNCSLPGSYPFYFDQLQSTYYVPEQGLIYAVFNTPPTSIYGTAVCAYNITSLNDAFNGPFKFQADSSSAWTRVPNNNVINAGTHCGASLTSSETKMASLSTGGNTNGGNEINAGQQRQLVDAQKYQMMDFAVQPTQLQPLLVAENQRFSHIVVDVVKTSKPREVTVLFLTSLEGFLFKYSLIQHPNVGNITCLVEMVDIGCDSAIGASRTSSRQIKTLQFDSKQGVVYIGTAHRIYRLPVSRCSRFKSKLQCLSAQDPYCGWSDAQSQCLPYGHPHLTACPLTTHAVDGGYCPWSSWQSCYQQAGGQLNEVTGHCLCRTRSCDCPHPRNGGRQCIGKSVEVTNCTNVDTDGSFQKSTSTELLPNWTPWSEWSPCSVRCGSNGAGFQTRTRSCQRSSQGTGRSCVGNDHEWTTCNSAPCDDFRKLSDWSHWTRVNTSRDGGHVDERFRCVCKASVSDASRLRAPQIRTSMRYCTPDNVDDCQTAASNRIGVPDVDGEWSAWSTWSECSALCGGGTKRRERHCNSPSPSGAGNDCSGHSKEIHDCNVHSCQGQWTCWTDYGQCSVSCGATGRRLRKRQCEPQPPGEYYTIPCPGVDMQQIVCTAPPCQQHQISLLTGWSPWSTWSPCVNEDNIGSIQSRYRNCSSALGAEPRRSRDQSTLRQPNAIDDIAACVGPSIESRLCPDSLSAEYDEDTFPTVVSSAAGDHILDPYASAADGTTPIRYYHVAAVGIICFLVGAIFSFVVTMHCHKVAFGPPIQQSHSTTVVSKVTSSLPSDMFTVDRIGRAVVKATPAYEYNCDNNDRITSSAAMLNRNGTWRTASVVRPSGCVDGDDCTQTATGSSQSGLIDSRRSNHRTNYILTGVVR